MRFICLKPAPLSSSYTFIIPLKICSLKYVARSELDAETSKLISQEELKSNLDLIQRTISDYYSFKMIRLFIILSIICTLAAIGIGARMRYTDVTQNVGDNSFLPNTRQFFVRADIKDAGIILVTFGVICLVFFTMLYAYLFQRFQNQTLVLIRGVLNRLNKEYREKNIHIRWCQYHIRWIEIKLDFKHFLENEKKAKRYNIFYSEPQHEDLKKNYFGKIEENKNIKVNIEDIDIGVSNDISKSSVMK